MMSDGTRRIREKIRSFQRKYYLNLFIRGAILTFSIVLGYLVIASLLEHTLWLSQWARFLIFLFFFGVAAFCVARFLREPLAYWLARKGLNEEDSARLIGKYLPGIDDRLVNFIQLDRAPRPTDLTMASVQQKAREFEPIAFDSVIDLGENRKHLRYLAVPVLLVLIILVFNKEILTRSTERIVHFNRAYTPEAPFAFIIGQNLTAFYNENFTLDVELQGKALPQSAYLVSRNQRLKLSPVAPGKFSYTFDRIQQPFDFQVEAAGFYSEPAHLKVVRRPELTRFNVELEFPRYLQRSNEKLTNAGTLEVPEGTNVRWNINTAFADSATISFASDSTQIQLARSGNTFQFARTFADDDFYEIGLQNEHSRNRERIAYTVHVVKDQHPQISVNNLRDTVLFQRVLLGGVVSDDHGVTQLKLHFRVTDEERDELRRGSFTIPIAKNQLQQSFFYNWSVDSLRLKPGEQLEYYLQVWDNDGVNGWKSTRSAKYTFNVPSAESLVTEISKSQQSTESQIGKTATRADELKKQIDQAHQRLKGKQSLDWQDKKMLEDIIQQKEGLDQMIEKLREQNKLLDEKKNAFTEQNERIREKAEQIQKLMDELLDEETKRLFDELKKLLHDKTDMSEIQKLLQKMNQNTDNLEKELSRTLELFKQLQFDFKLDLALNELRSHIQKQEELLKQTEELSRSKRDRKKDAKEDSRRDEKDLAESSDSKESDGEEEKGDDAAGNDESKQPRSSEDLARRQQQVKERFQETVEKLKELEELGKELNKRGEFPDEQQSQEIGDEQQQSQEMLEQNSPSKAKEPQQKALDKMKEMQQQMEGMQSSMMMEMEMQNLESLRQIIHGLVKLSFDQESLMKDFNALQQNDPRFNTLAQLQLKLKDDAKVLEDSLLALGKKDPMMGSYITREVNELNNHMNRVIESNKERRRPQASSGMQLTMTSINNLALMLDNHFDMMMQMMANAQPSMKNSSKKGQKPNLSQMQQQLNRRIEELKNSGKSGRELSEELAEMAAEQERIRRALQEMQEKMKEEGQMPGGELPSQMEQTEMDLVNKRLSDQMIERQRQILTRLLDAEKSMREQDMDEERKGETAKEYEKEIPKAFEEYLRLKEKEVELLKTVPPKLYPYYKREVNEYFKRMGTTK